MVDRVAIAADDGWRGTSVASTGLKATVLPLGADALAVYARFVETAHPGPAQHPHFVEGFASAAAEPVLLKLSRGGSPFAMLVLEVVRSGPFRLARFIGGSHANGNVPAALSRTPDLNSLDDLQRAVAGSGLAVDALVLERQAKMLDGLPNPFAALPHTASPNIALGADIRGGFEAVLDRHSGKRRRKKHRAQLRKFETAGGYRLMRASSADEIDAMLARCFELKAERFAKRGIDDPFVAPDVREAFRLRALRSLEAYEPSFVLDALEVGGIVRAVTGCSLAGRTMTCEFGGMAEDELSASSPGEFLTYHLLSWATEAGFTFFDYGVGDEDYKRQWCEVEIEHFDLMLPVSRRGAFLVTALKSQGALKRRIKGNPHLWALAKRIRSWRAQDASAAETAD